MMRRPGPALVVAVSTAVAGCASGLRAADEADVMAVTQAACDAFRHADADALQRLLAPEFTLVGPAGDVQPRAQAFAEVAARDPRYDVFENHDMTAHVYRDAATVQGITTLKGTSHGQPFALDVRFTDTLIRVDGAWKIVVSHVTRIPPPAH